MGGGGEQGVGIAQLPVERPTKTPGVGHFQRHFSKFRSQISESTGLLPENVPGFSRCLLGYYRERETNSRKPAIPLEVFCHWCFLMRSSPRFSLMFLKLQTPEALEDVLQRFTTEMDALLG